ncbi:MAG: polysaccharide pyruvyl transferase family protein [Gammaproteobacteria bacterium]|nr:polysaccharide pyruvyl transferase family protein [Gammaproteobacteria bacterium]
MHKRTLLIDSFSTLHVGNGALIENTYKLVKKYSKSDIDILSIDPATNKGIFENVYEDVFSRYKGNSLERKGSAKEKAFFSLSILWFFLVEATNEILFNGKLSFPWGENKKNLIRLINSANFCISLSGENINDHYYPHMYQRLLTYWLTIIKGKIFIVFPQSIGPIFRSFTRFFLRLSLGKAKYILARDNQSFQLASSIWKDKPVKILFCPDVAITQESDRVEIKNFKDDKKVIGLTVSDIPKVEIKYNGEYLDKIIMSLTKVHSADEYNFLVMPSNYIHGGLSKDYLICKQAQQKLVNLGYSAAILDNRLYYPSEYQGIQKSLFSFITTRMHAGILATSASVPTIMVNTQYKIRSYMNLIDMDEYVIELGEIDNLLDEKIRKIIEKNIEIKEKLSKNNLILRQRIEEVISNLF